MSTPTWTFATSFLTSFQRTASDLEARIHASQSQTQTQTTLQDEVQAFALELAKLTKGLADATGSLPSYDQRQCELQLKTLGQKLEDLRVSAAPKPKFAFKRKANPKPSSSLSLASSSTPQQELPAPPAQTAPTTTVPSPSSSTNITLTSHSNRYLTLESLPTFPSAHHSDLTISNLDGCIVNLLPSRTQDTSSGEQHQMSISALHIRDVTDTLLLLPIIQGSVILHNLKRCVVVFRMHTSKNIDVYLLIPSNPIIEHSSAIRFAPYPTLLSASAPTSDTKYSLVQDFSHIRQTQSPNWSIIPAGARRHDWLGLGLKEDMDVRKAVDELLPATS
ncbi:hypothetical protein PILCRDRAFT_83529 [Piloderma croceum F 1598]|uniref:C-CAP/cofactor C-like domain-containing protein n=1 Tax=Piloderma croceum (strain F 1598) TaxID=765440 RepID=A0A0C3CRN9_PILCF|nr:hypothetical protein PILCRDRAFT_83529 [Piloderma croceum F 1598]